MNVLPENAYFPVPIERTPAIPFWINPNHSDSLKEAEALLDDLFSTVVSVERRPQGLGVRTKLFSQPFATPAEWDQYDKQVRYLKAERFLDPFSTDLGPGRNAILGPVHYKGIGRNHAASRPEWLHSWGGMTVQEALSEIIIERMLDDILPQLSVPICGGFIYEDADQAFIIRESSFIRCEQMSASFSNETRSAIGDYLSGVFSSNDREQWHQKTIDGFIRLYQMGFHHLSPTLGNITIDGRILDHYSLEYFETSSPQEGLGCELGFATAVPEALSSSELWDYITKEPIVRARTSIDYVLNQCMITERSFANLMVPTVPRQHIEEQLRAKFHFAGQFLIRASERPTKVKALLAQFRNKDTTIYRTDFGNIMVEFGTAQRRNIIRTVTRLANFANRTSGIEKCELLAEIQEQTLKKFRRSSVDGL